MKDALNKKVEVGDTVVFTLGYYGHNIQKGRVVSITPKGVKIKHKGSEIFKMPGQIVKTEKIEK